MNDVHALLSCRGRAVIPPAPRPQNEHFTIDSIDHVEVAGSAGLPYQASPVVASVPSAAPVSCGADGAQAESAPAKAAAPGSHHATLQKAAAIQVSHRFPPTFETRGAWSREYVPQRPSRIAVLAKKDRGNVHPHPALCLSANGIKEEKPW